MKTKTLGSSLFLLGLILALTTPATAQNNLFLGGPRHPGHARIPLRANVAPAASVYYLPAQIRHAYGIDRLAVDGTGQKIAIIDAYGNTSIQANLNTFCTQFGLANTTVQVLGTSTLNSTWALETALDVEWAHVIAPKAGLILSVAKSASIGDLANAVTAAVNAGATVVSMSWGTTEYVGVNAYDACFQCPGVTFVASSGDSGELTGAFEVEWPAASPCVIGVGGTTLLLDANDNRVSETAWSNSGGGLSALYSRPTWQNGWSGYGYRGVPDVSYNADPNTGYVVYDGVNGGWFALGGTSAGAPQWAGLIALANQSRSAAVKGNTDIYAVAGTAPTIVSAKFFDVTSGENGTNADDFSVTGYDLVTGVGSPVASGLVPALIALAPPAFDFSISLAPASQTITSGAAVSYTVTVSHSGAAAENVSLSVALPAGASGGSFTVNPILAASGTSVLTLTAPASAGSFTVTVTGTSATSHKLHTASATLVVANPDFALSASPAALSAKRGSNAVSTIAVISSGGFTGTVALTATISPVVSSGPTVSFSPSLVGGGSGSSALTAKTTTNTPKGSYTITTTGTSGSKLHTTVVSLTVN